MRKYSHQRELVLRHLKKVKSHPTASEVYNIVKQEEPTISLATVYRNLNLLRDTGEIISFKANDGSEHFDGDISNHQHFYCTDCGKIYDIFMKYDVKMIQSVEESLECRVDNQQVLYYGSCKTCLNK